MKTIFVLLILILLGLQYKLWFAPHSFNEMLQLKKNIQSQQQKDNKLKMRNKALVAEIKDLKSGHNAIEELARNELGMIKKGEVFYEFVPEKKS